MSWRLTFWVYVVLTSSILPASWPFVIEISKRSRSRSAKMWVPRNPGTTRLRNQGMHGAARDSTMKPLCGSELLRRARIAPKKCS